MNRIIIEDYKILVLAGGSTPSAIANSQGHLFEQFIARFMEQNGFDSSNSSNINVTSEGIELDVVVDNSFTNDRAFAECKSYSSNVPVQALTSFYGKLHYERIKNPNAYGYLFTIPRLTADGEEQAKAIISHDQRFRYMNAQNIVEHMMHKGQIRPPQNVLPPSLLASDPALVITNEGIYACSKILDPESRRADRVAIWSPDPQTSVPSPVQKLLSQSKYGDGLPIFEPDSSDTLVTSRHTPASTPPVIATVRGSSSDFEYQFPASPKFFVGRREILDKLRIVIGERRRTFVLNAQSGWGKSSLALKLKSIVDDMGGCAIVIDSRTATTPQFVTESLLFAARAASDDGLLRLPDDSSWASLSSALSTIQRAQWRKQQPLVVFYDQFENVFLDEATTRQFRDLALSVVELDCPILIGFAWKTDLVGWTESHPYRLRDEIRSGSYEITVSQMGAKDIEALLRRLEKRLDQKLGGLKQRLREYSQGLPWLFKKLSEHVIREIEQHGRTKDQLINDALNIQNLFDADLAGLQPIEHEALRHVARFAPISASDATERYDNAVIQSLLDRRLIVPVGSKLDTYWDIFRDFLNTGQVPIEESYTIGINPKAAGPVVSLALSSGGSVAFSEIADTLGTSIRSVTNITRILRLLGIATYETGGVHLHTEIANSPDPEEAIQRLAAKALKRHKAFSLFNRLAEQNNDSISLSQFTEAIHQAFPAIEAKMKTWNVYARAFSLWFDYTGIASLRGSRLSVVPDGGETSSKKILSNGSTLRRYVRSSRKQFIDGSPGPAIEFLTNAGQWPTMLANLSPAQRRLARNLMLVGMLTLEDGGELRPSAVALDDEGYSISAMKEGLSRVAGGSACLQRLEDEPSVDNLTLGTIIRDELSVDWADGTTAKAGKDFRSWARKAGINPGRAAARPEPPLNGHLEPVLFDFQKE